MGFKFKPLAWMTGILTTLGALMTLDRTLEEAGVQDIIPEAWEPYVQGAIVLLTVILGKAAYDRVTPLAAPKDDAGTPLVPKNLAGPSHTERR